MLSCRQVTELCSQELERPLGLGERASLRLHLLACAGCANFRKQMKTLREAMQAYAQGRAPGDADADAGAGADAQPGQAGSGASPRERTD